MKLGRKDQRHLHTAFRPITFDGRQEAQPLLVLLLQALLGVLVVCDECRRRVVQPQAAALDSIQYTCDGSGAYDHGAGCTAQRLKVSERYERVAQQRHDVDLLLQHLFKREFRAAFQHMIHPS